MARGAHLTAAAFLLLPRALHATAAGSAGWMQVETNDDAQSLVQVQARMHGRRIGKPADHAQFYTREGQGTDCGKSHKSDMDKPIMEVLAKHPGVNGRCYFEFAAGWLNYEPVDDYAAHGRDLTLLLQGLNQTCFEWPGHGKAKNAKAILPGGKKLNGKLDCSYYAREDLYFYTLGWMNGQGLDGSLMTNGTAWKELAAKECAKLQEENGFADDELTIAQTLKDEPDIVRGTACAWGAELDDCDQRSYPEREIKRHAYVQCLLGHAPAEMAFGFMRGCMKGTNIHHGDFCGKCPDGSICP